MYRKSLTVVVSCAFLLGCTGDQGDQNKTLGALAGALAGGLLGSQVGSGKGKLAATAAGTLVGALIGHQIGKILSEKDQRAVGTQTNRALDGTADGKTVTWRNPDTGARAKLTPTSTKQVTRSVPILRKKEVAPPLSLDLIGKTYVAQKNSNLRAAPRTSSARIGRLRTGDRFQAVGKVTGETWILVGRNNRSVGYVHSSLVRPASPRKINTPVPKGATVIGGLPITDRDQPLRKAVDLDAFKQSTAVDLDKEDLVAEPVEVRQQCRTMQVQVDKKGETANEKFEACRASDGAWELI